MKIISSLFTILVISNLSLYAVNCSEKPTSENITSAEITQPVGTTDIDDLRGTNCGDEAVFSFRISSLPVSSEGILYLANGTTKVTLNQVLTEGDANGLKFDPADGFSGNATFTYAPIDESITNSEGDPATVTIPVIANGGDHPGGGNGGACTQAPETDDKANTALANSSAAVDIINLSGKDCANNPVTKFKIKSLPDPQSGILYMANGTAVTVGQTLTKDQADGLKFDPKSGFIGDAIFTYASIDANNREDATPATVTIPVTGNNGGGNAGDHPGGGNGGACTQAPETDDKHNDNLANTMPAVDILNLSGNDCAGTDITKFKIVTLSDAAQGVLYMADGVTAVTVGQTLTQAEADGLKFDPAPDFVGNATFTYAAIDGNNRVDATPAIVTIPVTGHNGGGNCNAPTTEDLMNPEVLNTMPAINILNLAGQNCAGDDVAKFEIKTLPRAEEGVLYMADGVTRVTVGQLLTREEANGLKFDPTTGFVGNAIFTYMAIDEEGHKDATPATVTIPVVNDNANCNPNDKNCTCDTYNSSVPVMTPFGMLLVVFLTLFAVKRTLKREL